MNSEQLTAAVRKLMFDNIMDGYSALVGAHYCYVMPSKDRYQYQWFWDTCFHVFILCALGELELAKRNLRSLFRLQEQDGFVGHMLFWHQILPHRVSDVLQARPTLTTLRPHMSALIQPPLVAQALKRVFDTERDRLFLYEILPKVVQYHDWLASNRDFDKDGLITIISPFESGIDWKPSFDELVGYTARVTPINLFVSELYWRVVLKVDASNFLNGYELPKIREKNVFLVKEVAFNTLYACDLSALADLCKLADLPERAAHYGGLAARVGNAIVDHMYDPQAMAFFDLKGGSNKRLKALTAMSLLPILLRELRQEIAQAVIERHFFDPNAFRCAYPIPSTAINDPSFCPNETLALWRGPTWPVMNWLLHRSLCERGFHHEADTLYRSTRALIDRSGFREYYNPFTGEGYGARNFTWSGLVVDMAQRHVQTPTFAVCR
jgi:glycogen debranching enzyme